MTVVIDTPGTRTWVGRFHEQDEHGVHLLDAAVHDTATAEQSRDDFLRRLLKFGVRAEHKHVLLPSDQVADVTPLRDLVMD
ncbi:MAG: hypothetical protein M3Y46_07920 [Actinomycetota bacterium]|nr:hypothetical protein [Gemmatimonadota bacterium]MDQ2698707.1 hypothetical protein [Actinomycetota bacterium]